MSMLDEVQALIKPGDVIAIIDESVWYKPWMWIAKSGIQWYQKRLFGKESDFTPTHVVLYFEPRRLFSATTPCVRWENLEFRLNMKFTIYRYTKQEYTEEHIQIMRSTAEDFLGHPYDIGDLLDFAISSLLGYDFVKSVRWFEFSRKYMVCSTAIRAIQEKLRKTLEETMGEDQSPFSRLFNKLNPDKWSAEDIAKFVRTDVEMTTPGHYANSGWFESEFRKICSWRDFS